MTSRLLMHVGPSIGNYNVLSAAVQPNIGFASPEFNAVMKNSLEGLSIVMGTDRSYMPFILPGDGTVAMESVTSFLPRGSKILIISNGVFGDRWEAILKRYPVEITVLHGEPGETVPVEKIEALLETGSFFAVAMTQVETSTGVRIDVEKIAKMARKHVTLVIVDGVASIGGELMKAAEWGVDVCLTASQKALGAQTGAGLLVASEKAISQLKSDSINGYFMDLRNWKDIMQKFLDSAGGYFATPSIGTVFSISRSIDIIRREGMEQRIKRHEVCSSAFRAGIEALGLQILAAEGLRSNTVSGVVIDQVDIPKFLGECMKNGVEFGAGVHPKVKDMYFRVGHMGWVEPAHIIRALNTIETSLSSLGHKTNSGAELAAKKVFEKNPPLPIPSL